MQLSRRASRNLQIGQNLDLYATLATSFTIGALGLFNIVDDSVVAGATLATLGLVALGSLGERLQVARLTSMTAELLGLARQQFTQIPSADRLLVVSTSGLNVELKHAADIRMIGVTLCRTIRNHILTLQKRLEEGAVIRIAVIAPSVSVVKEAARRSTIPDSLEVFENRLRPTFDLLRQLTSTPRQTGRVEVRLLSFVPAFGLIAVDPEEKHGHIHVDIYSHRASNEEPTLPLLASRDHQWYQHFLHEFDRMWSTGQSFEGYRPDK